MDMTRDFLLALWLVTAQMAPWLLLGFLVAGLLSVYVSARWLERHLGSRGMAPVWKASLFGVPLPLCSCGVLPVGASLRRHGASRAATTAFLISTPQTGVDSIAVTGALLGPVFAVFRPVAALLTGILGGALVHLAVRQETTPPVAEVLPAAATPVARLRSALQYGFDTLPRDIGRPLVIGLLLAALITVLVPAGSLSGLLGGGLLPILAMVAVGIPLYVCATGSVPLAAGFIHAGVSPGAALAFLIAGPATNAAMITTLLKVLGRRTTVLYLATIAGSAVGGGLLLDAVVRGLDLPIAVLSACHDHTAVGWLDHVWAGLLTVNLVWVFRPRRAATAAGTTGAADQSARHGDLAVLRPVTLRIEGMTCHHCRASVERILGEQAGVRRVIVDLATGRAEIHGDALDPARLSAAVNTLGFRAQSDRSG